MTCATKTIQQPERLFARVKTNDNNDKRLIERVCRRRARLISEKRFLEQKFFFFLALSPEIHRMCKNVSACAFAGERSVGRARVFRSFTCVCVCIFRRYNEKKVHVRVHSLYLSLSLLLFSLPPRSALSSFSIYFNVIILCASSFVLSRLLSLSLSSCNCGIFFS